MLDSIHGNGSLLIVLFLLASVPLATAAHELGHAALGVLAKYRVIACGIGFGRPLFVVQIGGVCFFIAWPMRVGLTLATQGRLTVSRGRQVAFLAGGIVANTVCAAASMILWIAGIQGRALAAFFVVSVMFAIGNSIPFRISKGGLALRSDGRAIIDTLRGEQDSRSPGATLMTTRALREFCRALGTPFGEVVFTLRLAMTQLALGDLESASETLADPCLSSTSRHSVTRPLEALVRALYAIEAGSTEVETTLATAREACEGDPIALSVLALSGATRRIDAGESVGTLIEDALASSRSARSRGLEAVAESLLLEADPPKDFADAARRLLARRGADRLAPSAALRLTAFAAERASHEGDFERARSLFAGAVTLMGEIAGRILSLEQQQRFIARVSKPLHAAMAVSASAPIPLFIPPLGIAPKPREAPFAVRSLFFAFLFASLVAMFLRATTPKTDVQDNALTDHYESLRLEKNIQILRALRRGDSTPAITEYELEVERIGKYLTRTRRRQTPAPPPEVLEASADFEAYLRQFPRHGVEPPASAVDAGVVAK